MGRVTDVAPAGLVPAAWLVTSAAHVSAVSARTLFIALVVMDVLLAVFSVAGREEMSGRVLRVWLGVLVAGLAVTLVGTVDMALTPVNNPALPVTLYGWMILPGVAYLQTGRLVSQGPYAPIYAGAGGLSLIGAVLYAAGHVGPLVAVSLLWGLAVVGVGQSVGMVTATVQNTA
jgi:hypothetical protein